MTQDLLIGLVALAAAAGPFVVALPNRYGESPRFLQFYAAPMVVSGDGPDISHHWDRRIGCLGHDDESVGRGAQIN
jgi:hypothetical protein